MGWRRLGEDAVVVKQPANLENGRAEEEEVDGEQVIWLCNRRTGNRSYDAVKPDKANEELREEHCSEDRCLATRQWSMAG